MSGDNSQYIFKNHPETCDPEDVWGQVKRTVGGEPVSPEQITLIVDTIKSGLDLGSQDTFLDLCCGNGALTTHLFAGCSGGLGVDYSEFLINVANRRFVQRPSERYLLSDALDYVMTEENPQLFTKVACYGAFPYFGEEAATRLLTELSQRFKRVTHVFLGQIPDKTRLGAFYADRKLEQGEENNPGGLLGIWRTPAEMADLAERSGWTARCDRMPDTFFASHYRFDAVLTRP
jgi:cyclopropane fatty-acyl-phospholipid synthase-like methyltransferase